MNKVKIRNKRITVLLASILALTMIFSCVGILFGNGGKANAFQGSASISSGSTNLGEMLLDRSADTTGTNNVFDGEVFWKLVSQVTGESNPTAATLDNLGTTEKTSADFRANNQKLGNGSKDIVVMIDGIPWTATYLSYVEKTVGGKTVKEPVLTLWQADAVAFNYFNSGTNAMVNNAVNTTWSTSDNYSNSIAKYPSNSYGTSFMATNVLNNGGAWAKTNTGTVTATQSTSNTYAKFTMPNNASTGMKNSLTDFIEVPNDMAYQKDNAKESAKTLSYNSSYAYDANNDCLGAPIKENMYQYTTTDSPRIYYTNTTADTTGYLGWGNDKIWLPSFAEVGYSDSAVKNAANIDVIPNGLWKTSANQRSTSTSVSSNSVSYSWLRSAD